MQTTVTLNGKTYTMDADGDFAYVLRGPKGGKVYGVRNESNPSLVFVFSVGNTGRGRDLGVLTDEGGTWRQVA